jgi:predicted small metal-binding protein
MRPALPAVRKLCARCGLCAFAASAVTEAALREAMVDHEEHAHLGLAVQVHG